MSAPVDDLPLLLFASQHEWDRWLEENHATSPGVWLRFAKKGSSLVSLSYDQAVETGLCHGWIDSLKKTYDSQSWMQKFTPRKPQSLWSKINRERAENLIESGAMRPGGLAAIDRARANGRWDAAYDSHGTATVPDDLQAELDRDPDAAAFFATLSSTNRYAILFRVQTAKRPETRARRIREYMEMLRERKVFHP
jgi:uncharacterized protein YdeI (YjbR/CyaY-like superfamily)